ncbi:MAG TPA: glycine--tRNA ligase [Candidatus Saccharimonadales bacterium]|nr:glycine--tRNA ligase [Candidatus Saccharimonadales bacterium]
MSKTSLDDIVSLAKRRGFIYQGSEIYGGLAGTWDYGPLGVQLKRNIVNLWWKMFVENRNDMYGLDAAILMNSKVWQASGHATGFNDPMVECSNCHSRLRADHVKDDKCPVCGKTKTFGKPKQFNMMFQTQVGPVNDDKSKSYLRPETAQGIFVNYKNVIDTFSPDLPFGIAQIGKAFRNEISPRDFTFRSREFEQMEIEYFIDPKDWQTEFNKWVESIYEFLNVLGLTKTHVHELDVPAKDRAHYSEKTIDFEFDYPFGKSELLGLAYRTDFDLKNIETATGKSMDYRPKDGSKPFAPHVIEPSFGLDRLVLAILVMAYDEDKQNDESRTYLKLPAYIAPVKIAVSPLLKNKPELVKKARAVYDQLKQKFGAVMWDDNGNIGKRYRRQDEIGTPYCVTIDFDTLDNDTVTVRSRDTTEQIRVKIQDVSNSIKI